MARDPVCGMDIEPEQATAQVATADLLAVIRLKHAGGKHIMFVPSQPALGAAGATRCAENRWLTRGATCLSW